ncbi:tRNA-guanine transglycosylase, various specificities [Methanohalobium evestigatum Z-7303]|uniref:tRNA-guanine transglycosylase, various specificities n=1 Tax=Methanohalobium evestigatum (strain ATCC BAA-1072 / DSM 3721 / NBRC 107634 / OCM 161 / Z-7303) TaxID=644295 RepID=D7E5U5_METEZ|nr:archaeosine synthase subunit alpha [Methanohalobium evestigatum]ADI72967.1 tRNA-guanine transglycosylase, various specificities [Methanohalobium evestigatum Z-7303]
MTKHFEVEQRDGKARLGKLILSRNLKTPCIINIEDIGDTEKLPIIDAGSVWKQGKHIFENQYLNQLRQKVSENNLIILPHQNYPYNVPDKAVSNATGNYDIETSGATGSVFHPGKKVKNSDLYIMEGGGGLENNARQFFNALKGLKEEIPHDTAVYVPNIALPENLAMLIYLGADVFDYTRATISAYNDIYLTSSGKFYLYNITELPCRCDACTSVTVDDLKLMDAENRGIILEEHNKNMLDSELSLVREKIRKGYLREYVEGQCRTQPWLTALLRIADFDQCYLEEQFPTTRTVQLTANTSESLNRPEITRFAERVQNRYTPPKKDILLLLPCSARKPYSTSNSHQKFIDTLGQYRKYVHELVLTSPLGIVPRELELTYPAAHYDIAVTGHWDADEVEWVTDCLVNYLSKNKYSCVVAHVEGAYQKVCDLAARKLGIDIVYTCESDVTSKESLEVLKDTIKNLAYERTQPKPMSKHNLMRAIADYQFGKGAGNILVPDDAVIKAPYPKHQVYLNKEQIATLVPHHGTLSLTARGAELLIPHDNYVVKIGSFVPKGSILAPGIQEADVSIRPGDEVLISGENAIGVGRALMSGREMEKSTRGIAITLRHVKKT